MCGREPTGPRVGEISGTARFVLQPDLGDKGPLFQAAGLQVDRIHIVIRGADGTIVFERDVVFPAGQNEVSITADVPVHGETERFRASYELFSGTTAMFTGTVEVTGKPGVTTTTPSVVPTTFVGPGATATRVDVTPASSSLLAGATTTLTATAFDNASAAILGTPFVWSSSNPTVAAVSPTGVVTAGNTRGNATISASTISGVTGSATVSVSLPAARIIIVSGDAQTGRAGQALAAPIVFEVQASDGVVVPNAAITFAAVSGGGSVNPASAASAATGRASLTPTLGGTLGAQTFRATTGAFSVTATATATPGTPTQITIVGGNTQTDSIGRQLLPFVVRATDTFGNLTPGISVAWARTQGAGTVSAATSLTDAQGQAQIIYTLGNTPGNETVTATLPAPSTANVSFTANAIARQAASLTIVSGNGQGGTVGQAASPLVVQARDALGNPTVGATINWTTAGGGTLGAATSTTDAQGQAQDAFTHGTIPGVTTVTARLATNPNLFANFALTAYAGTVAALQIVNGNGQTAATGAAVATPPAAEAVDAFGNPVPGVSVTFTPSAGGSVTGSPAITNAAGIATVGSWTLGPAGPNTLTASVGALVANFSATATAPVGPNTLSITTQPSGSVQNTAVFPQQPSIQLKNAAGGNLLTSGVVVTVSVQSGTATLRGTLTASTNASGVATFVGLSVLGATGNITLGFAAGGFTGATSGTMVITVGPAAFIAATTATAFGATVGSVVSPVPQVIVKDSSNTPISGVAVTWATPAPGNGGLITGGGPVTNGSGLSSPVQWTLDAVPGNDTLTAAVAGALGSPVYFVATTTAGAATQLAIVSGDNQTGTTGTPLASGMVVIAKDALNNPVSGINITFTSFFGGGTPASQTIATNGSGQASFTLTLGAPGTDSVSACLPSCATAKVVFAALSIPVGADIIWTGATNSAWSNSTNWSPVLTPGAASNVFIPAGTANAPALSASVSVNHLTLASGASLAMSGFNVTIGGDLLATGATMTGIGVAYFCGGTHQLSGGVPEVLVDCSATVNPAGTVTSSRPLTVQSGSVFNVGTAVVTVSSLTLPTNNGSRLKMNGAGKLTVTGNAYFNSADMNDTDLTDGVLEIGGNFDAQSNNYTSFRAVGNHLTRFIGPDAQAIYFYYPSFGQSRFANLEFATGTSVTLNNPVIATGTVNVLGTAMLASSTGITTSGLFTSAASTNLSGMTYLSVQGSGNLFPLISGSGPGTVYIETSVTVNAPAGTTTLPTNLVVQGGATLVIGGSNLTIAGDLTYPTNNGSRLKMTNAAGVLTVNGNAYFNAVDMNDTDLTDGTLQLKGNFQAQSNNYTSFRAVGNHLTRFIGSSAQAIYFYYPSFSQSQFAKLEFAGNNTVTLNNPVIAAGTVNVAGTTTIASGQGVTLNGLFTSAAGTTLSGMAYVSVQGSGNIFPLILGSGPGTVYIETSVTVNAPAGTTTLPSNLVVQGGATLVIGASNLTIAGDLTYPTNNGSRLKMTNAAGVLTVNGNAYFNAVDMNDTDLTDGTLQLKGNFQAQSNNYTSFRAVGNHLTRFIGSSAQAIYFYYPSFSQSQFAKLEFAGNNTVTLNNPVIAAGTVNITGTTVLSATQGITTNALLTSSASTSLSGMAYVSVQGSGNIFPLILGSGPVNTYIETGVTVNAPAGTTTLPSNLVVQGGATLVIGASNLTIAGNLTYPTNNGSHLVMTNAAGVLTVNGDSYFNSADMYDTDLTDGTLQFKGNFQAQNNNYTSFRAVGNHLTRFIGSGAQSIYFYYPSFSQSQFAKLEFAGNNTVTLNNPVVAAGTVNVAGTTALAAGQGITTGGLFTSAAGTSLASMGYVSVQGSGNIFPLILGSGPGTVYVETSVTVNAPAGTTTLPSNLVVQGGATLVIGGSNLTITGNLSFPTNNGSRLKMTNAAGVLTVNGDVYFNAADMGDGDLTDGTLEVKGNFTAQSNNNQSFRATGSHLTRFAGTAGQSIYFYYPGPTQSQFANLEIANASGAGVTPTNSMYVAGTLNQLGKLTITSVAVNVGGAVSLGASSITNVVGGFTFGGCSKTGSPTFTGFICP